MAMGSYGLEYYVEAKHIYLNHACQDSCSRI